MAGNVMERVDDCYRDTYSGAPADGSAQTSNCSPHRIFRGASWYDPPVNLRTAYRSLEASSARNNRLGFRCAR